MKVINISYRLPVSFENKEGEIELKTSAGGLVSAIRSMKTEDNELHWVGVADFSRVDFLKGKDLYQDNITLHPVFLDEETNENFYNGFSNTVIWPLFHYFTSFVEFKPNYLNAYVKANQIIADQLAPLISPHDVVWIHDYHLMPLAAMIREKQPNAKIGFFLHIPFPSYELIRLLPKNSREVLVKGMLGADVIGFHTYDYVEHFLSTVQMIEGIQHKQFNLLYKDRLIRIGAFPISIDFNKFNDGFDDPFIQVEREKIKNHYPEKKIIFSVDRLDYTKGIIYRLNGFAHFLKTYPAWKGKIVFILVAVPSRDAINKYVERKQMIELLISEINGKYGSARWTPIVYQYSSLSFNELMGLYTCCDIALISPLRDGMNLVAKEFVASRKDQEGVLLLSDMTGTAKELTDALLFNPIDEQEIASKIQLALKMKKAEQKKRMEHLQHHVKKYDISKWATDFITELNLVTRQQTPPLTLDLGTKREVLMKFQNASHRLLLLDYDGTLTGFKSQPEEAKPDANLLRLLAELTSNPKNTVALVSGRDRSTLEEWFGKLPITLIAEHGTFVKKEEWKSTITDLSLWKDGVLNMMNRFADSCHGSFVEEKSHALCWHYRNADAENGFAQSRELVSILSNYLIASNANIIDGNKVIEVKPSQMNKGAAILQLFNLKAFDFILAVGDDKTDEDMFEVLNQCDGITVKVGKANSVARYRLETIQLVLSFLEKLK